MKLLDTQKASEYIGVQKRTLQNWRHLGKGPAYIKPEGSGTIHYDIADLDAYLQSRRVDPQSKEVNG